jgi:phosphoribosylformylglycinamidine synthase
MSRRAFVLRGEGIECEEELFRFLSLPELGFQCVYVNLPELFENPDETLFKKLQESNWVFFPGGFSFADHFGSGRLLSFELASIHFFKTLLERNS